jgi:hypothetical protein
MGLTGSFAASRYARLSTGFSPVSVDRSLRELTPAGRTACVQNANAFCRTSGFSSITPIK